MRPGIHTTVRLRRAAGLASALLLPFLIAAQDPPTPVPKPQEPVPIPAPAPDPAPNPAPAPTPKVEPAATPKVEPKPAPQQPDPAALAPSVPSAVVVTAPVPKPVLPPVYEPRYHDPGEIAQLLDQLASSQSGLLVEKLALAPTPAGANTPALVFGTSEGAPLAARTTVLLLGGLDGVSLCGSEAILSATCELFLHAAELPHDVAFIVVPWASPDALERTRKGTACDGRDLEPFDDDGDGRVDEDGPDDVDGDKLVLEMLLEDPAGEWTRSSDPRFLAHARPGDTPRYQRLCEGRDDDGDGRFNEDPLGGVVLDLCFPLFHGVDEPASNARAGRPLPLDAQPARALADLVLARRTALVLLFQGEHGGIACADGLTQALAAGPASLERSGVETLVRSFAKATNRSGARVQSLTQARGAARPGNALEWFYRVAGVLAVEVSAWGPEVERPSENRPVNAADARFDEEHAHAQTSGPPPPDPIDQAWGRWLDNTRGGIGFVDWHPVDLGGGRAALVGGWEPFSRQNPPLKSLPAALAGMGAFVLEAARSLGTLEIALGKIERDGELCTIRARVLNKGKLPSALSTSSRWAAFQASPRPRSLELTLILPPGARLFAGEAHTALSELVGGAATSELSWTVLAAPNSVFTLRAESPWIAPLAREVKP